MNYTIDLINHGQQKSTADIDHFYLKSEYPEYALCLYNFVPSCSVCNGRLKGSHSMNRESYIFPHEDSFENKSNFAVKNIIEYILGDENGLTLMLEHSTGDIAVENSAKLFKIEERYQQLGDYAKNLVDKYLDYSSLYMDELENDFESLFSTGNIRQLVFGSIKSEKEFSRDSLGKLNRDLLLQLGIFDDEK